MSPELTARELYGCVIVEVRGEADIGSAPALGEYLSELVAMHSSAIVLDLSCLAFADCAALRVLLEAERRAASQARPVVLAAPRPVVARLLQVTGLDRHFAIFATAAEAAATVGKGRSRGTPEIHRMTPSTEDGPTVTRLPGGTGHGRPRPGKEGKSIAPG